MLNKCVKKSQKGGPRSHIASPHKSTPSLGTFPFKKTVFSRPFCKKSNVVTYFGVNFSIEP